ncbi:MAG: family 20 glycosylhydrolase, partial [Clostridia bacterium]|nr:family 20 glycosylhydrolase [Clostridia bacterium]
MNIFPKPKKIEITGPFNIAVTSFKIVANDFPSMEFKHALTKLNISDEGMALAIICNKSFSKERYSLELTNLMATITASTPRGVFNGLLTLSQLIKQSDLQCVKIEDEPDFDDRCVMIDVSRGRIPTIEDMKKTVDRFAELKYNQIQLAFDAIVYEYKGFEKYYEGREIVTAAYVKEIIDYAKKNMIDVVPNQNSFGHMHEWLALDDFKDLRECPEGFTRTDEYNRTSIWQSGTLNPYDPRSLELVDRIYTGLLGDFESPLMHVCCDETFELLTDEGKSYEMVKKLGANKVYTDYMNKLDKICKKHGKRMMFWADMIIDSLDALKDMPKDAMPVLWGYEQEHPFDVQCKTAAESGLEFYVAPGTCSWGSIVGRSTNMRLNQLSAAKNGKKYGARGYLLTDWGDCGHAQFPVITYLPVAYGAGLSWGTDENEDISLACAYLDDTMFIDKGFASFLYDCGEAHRMEAYKRFNQAVVVTVLSMPFDDNYLMY